LLSILVAATVAGCQTGGERPAEDAYRCVVTPTDLVECDPVDGADPPRAKNTDAMIH
jgi:hypothetical protein